GVQGCAGDAPSTVAQGFIEFGATVAGNETDFGELVAVLDEVDQLDEAQRDVADGTVAARTKESTDLGQRLGIVAAVAAAITNAQVFTTVSVVHGENAVAGKVEARLRWLGTGARPRGRSEDLRGRRKQQRSQERPSRRSLSSGDRGVPRASPNRLH